jgi:hypothetical protein
MDGTMLGSNVTLAVLGVSHTSDQKTLIQDQQLAQFAMAVARLPLVRSITMILNNGLAVSVAAGQRSMGV